MLFNVPQNPNPEEAPANQSANMYSYHEDQGDPQYPQETGAIRRSVDNNNPQGINSNNNNNNNFVSSEPIIPSENSNKMAVLPRSNSIVRIEVNPQKLFVDHPKLEPKRFFLIFYPIVGGFQILMIILIGCLFKWDELNKPGNIEKKDNSFENWEHFEKLSNVLEMFQDTHIMVFVGFGLLYTFLKHHSWSSVAVSLFMGVSSVEFGLFCLFLWKNCFKKEVEWSKMKINFESFIYADFNAATVLVTLGAIIGKLSIPQYFITMILETFFGTLNFYLCEEKLGAVDIGGSMYIFEFGALFALGMLFVLFRKNEETQQIMTTPHKGSNYFSNIVVFIGALIIWAFFPSFNTVLLKYHNNYSTKRNTELNNEFINDNQIYRGEINTYLSILGSVIGSFVTSPLLHEGKFNIEQIINAIFSGGVIIASFSHICAHYWAALLIGSLAGAITIIFHHFLKPLFVNKFKFFDSAGVIFVFGVPGILGGFLSAIFVSDKLNCYSHGKIKSEICWPNYINDDKFFESGRKNSKQSGIQVAAIFITLAFALSTGFVSGVVSKFMKCQKNEKFFTDSELFDEEESEPLPEYEEKYNRQMFIQYGQNNLSSTENKMDENKNNNNDNSKVEDINNNKNSIDNNANPNVGVIPDNQPEGAQFSYEQNQI